MTSRGETRADEAEITRLGYEELKRIASLMDALDLPEDSAHPLVAEFTFLEMYLPKVRALEDEHKKLSDIANANIKRKNELERRLGEIERRLKEKARLAKRQADKEMNPSMASQHRSAQFAFEDTLTELQQSSGTR